ncbi:coth protein-domain-containing protein [Dichotomocladium elegans]|nr:coth protein-domain-containing protein [Dichotomocladium elegans]
MVRSLAAARAVLLLSAFAAPLLVSAADVNYAVVAFPTADQGVSVSIDGQLHPLSPSPKSPYIFEGSGPPPSSSSYQYVLTSGSNQIPEATTRQLGQGKTSTGNEFFNRSKTVYDVPDLPQAFNPIYPPLFTGMNMSNEIATIILTVNQSGIDEFLRNPSGNFGSVLVSNMTYISSNQVYSFSGAGMKTSGQSTKEFAKQSWAIDLNKFAPPTQQQKQLLFGRTTVKLRAHETDPTFAREKLLLDCLAAAGAGTLSGSWVRVYLNGRYFGLFLMTDEASTHFIDAAIHGGNFSYAYTGPTFKGNALSETQEANLLYLGDDPSLYSVDIYKNEDNGVLVLNKTDELRPLIELTKRISQNQSVVDPTHTLLHMAFNFLSGSWDGFWYQASNYYINQDLQSNQWTLITYDFDETFGNGAPPGFDTLAYQNFSKPGSANFSSTRPLQMQMINQHADIFETILKTIVKRFFKPSIIQPRLQAWAEMLREDIVQDRASAVVASVGTARTWTVQDFEGNMFNTTSSNGMGILAWVTSRSAAVCQQLNINDTDTGLPVLGPYTGGAYGDGARISQAQSSAGANNGKSTPAAAEPTPSQGSSSGARDVSPTLFLFIAMAAAATINTLLIV